MLYVYLTTKKDIFDLKIVCTCFYMNNNYLHFKWKRKKKEEKKKREKNL